MNTRLSMKRCAQPHRPRLSADTPHQCLCVTQAQSHIQASKIVLEMDVLGTNFLHFQAHSRFIVAMHRPCKIVLPGFSKSFFSAAHCLGPGQCFEHFRCRLFDVILTSLHFNPHRLDPPECHHQNVKTYDIRQKFNYSSFLI